MISKEELIAYKMPPKINFEEEENRLRNRNINKLKEFLLQVSIFPHMIEDFQNISRKDFTDKYGKITNNEKIYEDCNNFLIKIRNYANNFNLNKNYLIKRLQDDEIFASNFIIDFKKQNPYEPFVEKYFLFLDTDLKLITNFKHLPVSGPTAKYVYNGLICDESIKVNVQVTPPSVDFIWEYKYKNKIMIFYASHKYTQGTGTAQKNQMRDLETFLDHSLLSASTNNDYFLAIMDGNYYTDYNYPNYIGAPKPKVIEHIKNTKESKKCKIATSYNLIEIIILMIKSWLNENFSKEETIKEIEKLDIIKRKLL